MDEVLNGRCDTIEITLDKNRGIASQDNGRGIPVDTFQKTRKSAMEILFTTLHSGGANEISAKKIPVYKRGSQGVVLSKRRKIVGII